MGRKRCVFVLATADYRPELCALTLPNEKRYADRLGADFVRIQERKLPNFPLTFERMQIYELWHPLEGTIEDYLSLFRFKDDWVQQRI